MNNLISHIRINDFNSPNTYNRYQYNVQALEPFDALKVVLEQAIYLKYISMASISEESISYLQRKIMSDITALKDLKTYSTISSLNSLFEIGKKIALYITSNPYEKIEFLDFTPNDLIAIFNTPNQKEYLNQEYTSTMTENFLTQFISYFLGYFNKDQYPDGILHQCAIYIPNLTLIENYDPRLNAFENAKNKEVIVSLTGKLVKEYDLNMTAPMKPCIHCYLRSFNLSDLSIDDYIGILASFSLSHDKYVMTASVTGPDYRIPDACFDLVTGSSFVRGQSTGEVQFKDKEAFFESINLMVEQNKLQKIEDNGLFGALLTILGEKPDLVNFFTKPVTSIASIEALTYRQSEYTKITNDRIIASMEAIDDTEAPEENEGTEEPEDDASNEIEEGEDDTNLDDTSLEDPSLDPTSAEDEEEDKKPPLDPKMMLLELANPTQSMSDYIYREMVARRISYIIKNPPENALPNDILMLKRWKSRWLYLASIACLRDFLSRVSIRLSDI